MSRRTAQQLAQTRQLLLAAAGELFAERGFGNTQIAEIAEHAGVGISSFYRQFDNKQQLLHVVIKSLFDDVRAQLVASRDPIGSHNPLQQLMAIQRSYDIVFQTLYNQPKVALTMLRSGYGTTLQAEQLVWDSLNAIVNELVADLQRAEDNGVLQFEQKRNFADAVVGVVIQLGHRMLVDGTPGPVEAAKFCTRFTVGAMLAFVPKDKLDTVTTLMTTLGW